MHVKFCGCSASKCHWHVLLDFSMGLNALNYLLSDNLFISIQVKRLQMTVCYTNRNGRMFIQNTFIKHLIPDRQK